jgi:hypothetical protein
MVSLERRRYPALVEEKIQLGCLDAEELEMHMLLQTEFYYPKCFYQKNGFYELSVSKIKRMLMNK